MKIKTLAIGLAASTFFGGIVFAADVGSSQLPAVSAVNGKVEFAGGWADIDPGSSDELFYGAAALSVPLGDTLGLQGDFAVLDVFGETALGGAAHLFTRDPNSYLLGVVGGYMDSGSGNILWGGAEGELYLDNISIQAVAGLSDSDSNIVGANTGTDFISLIDVSFYATENMRFIASGSTVANFESAGLGFEWLLSETTGLPVSFKADARFGENDFTSAKAGLTFYFGGNDSSKSLIRRHREDDPDIRAFGGGSGAAVAGAGVLGGSGNPCVMPAYAKSPTASIDPCYGMTQDAPQNNCCPVVK